METRKQNLNDAQTLLDTIRNGNIKPLPDIWLDLTDAQIADEVDRLGHIVEWLNLA